MTDLWAVHTLGPDDLHACASRRLAVRNANWLNLSQAGGTTDRLDDEMEPLIYSVPVIWDGSPEGHADGLAEEDKDPRWSDTSIDVIGDLARHKYAGIETGPA